MWRVYEHQCVGQNFRLPECLGALGLAACENLPVMIEQKRKIHNWYLQYTQETSPTDDPALVNYMSEIKFQKGKPLDNPVWWINSLLLPGNAEKVGLLLMSKYPHIEVRPAFFPLHKMGIFVETAEPSPNADFLYDRLLCLPSSANLLEEDIMEICAAVRECVAEAHL
jgi:dTDP-4-amino-4,6-dideoxygalactose transaminase